MKILYIGPAVSTHLQKWFNAFNTIENEVFCITQHATNLLPREKMFILPVSGILGYYFNFLHVRRMVKKINPDIINVHYASGYGTLARLAKIPPYLLNVWGSDVFDFPYESNFKMRTIKKNLLAAYQIASTSIVMKKQTLSLVTLKKEIVVTPFGVDTQTFFPKNKTKNKIFIIGTVKTLEPKYGIDILIQAFAHFLFLSKNTNVELHIVGDGHQLEELVELTNKLRCKDKVKFLGKIAHKDVPNILNTFDIFAALSNLESFGVSVIEAEACGLPVIVSNAGGLPEVVNDGITGYIVNRGDYLAAGNRLNELFTDSTKRMQMGQNARTFICEKYSWDKSVNIMNIVYKNIQKSLQYTC